MTGPTPRRDFLRGLVSLPLIGGGVTLIGNPSAVAAPITHDLMLNYETWLAGEIYAINAELHPNERNALHSHLYCDAIGWHAGNAERLPLGSRAALVLSAVGCGWGRSWL